MVRLIFNDNVVCKSYNKILLTPETPEDPLDIDSSESEYGLLANIMIYFSMFYIIN